ncbi:DNA packaging protein [Breoghania sp. L-A4]|nr:DNA packaging protein [Breoghania sp. L-A4]
MQVDAVTLARLVNLSDRKVRDLAQRGIMVRLAHDRYDLAESLASYATHLREMAAGRGAEQPQVGLTAERARLAKEQADTAALKNAAMRKELVAVTDVEHAWCDVLRKVRAGILATPERLRSTLPHLASTDIEALDTELRRTLETLADDHA